MADEETTDDASEQAEQPEQPAAPRAGGRAVAERGAANGTLAADAGHAVVVAQPRQVGPPIPQVSRRGVLKIAFWSGMGAMLAAIATTIVYSLYPRRAPAPGGQQLFGTSEVSPFGGIIPVGKIAEFEPGKPVHNLDARAWIMTFDQEHADRENAAGNHVEVGAILALYQKCVHLGCTVPWRPDFTWTDDRPGVSKSYSGWFRCPCHGSTYTFGGVRVFGPAPRSLDTFAISNANGVLMVNTGKITLGDTHDPDRAVKF